MLKLNCWEIMKCGREPGGVNLDKLGVCPAAESLEADGINEGKKGGRICWAVAGTFCHGAVQGRFANDLDSCILCKVFQKVKKEEGLDFRMRVSENNELN
jgi:hypothetical protein